jgi:hypothetical protein
MNSKQSEFLTREKCTLSTKQNRCTGLVACRDTVHQYNIPVQTSVDTNYSRLSIIRGNGGENWRG